MHQIQKISVVGAGAIGTIFGGLIKHHHPEIDVVLITRGPHYQRMSDTGQVVLRGFWGQSTVAVKASTDPQHVAGSDVVLFTVKTQDTAETARGLADVLDDAIVISLQNGINQRLLAQFVRDDRLLVGMTATNMAMIEPGVVSLQRNGVSVIGPPSPAVPADVVAKACQSLALSGLKIEAADHILGVQYNKLLMNTMGYASVLSASDFIAEGILYGPWRRNVALPLLSEGLTVLRRAGIQLERTSGISDVMRFRRLLLALNTPAADWIVRGVVANVIRPERIVYSVYQDLVRQKPTEIDYINGEILHLAKQHGSAAPYNELVVQMVHELEQSGGQTFPSRAEVIQRFRDQKGA